MWGGATRSWTRNWGLRPGFQTRHPQCGSPGVRSESLASPISIAVFHVSGPRRFWSQGVQVVCSACFPTRQGQCEADRPQPGQLTADLLPQVPLCCPDLGRREKVLCPGRVQPPAGLRPREGASCGEPPSGSPWLVRDHTCPASCPTVGGEWQQA